MNGIPICPNCNKGTQREFLYGTTTCMHIPTYYDKDGKVMESPIKNNTTDVYRCCECGKQYSV
jgi:hypothetical protein